jgi:hypothetical protein
VSASGEIAILSSDASLQLLDADGKERFRRPLARCTRGALVDLSGSVVVHGCAEGAPGEIVQIMRLDASGKDLWRRAVVNGGERYVAAMAPDGATLLAHVEASGDGPGKLVVHEIDPTGGHAWSARVPVPEEAFADGGELVALAADGERAVLAFAAAGERIGTTLNNPYAVAYDRAVTFLWSFARR